MATRRIYLLTSAVLVSSSVLIFRLTPSRSMALTLELPMDSVSVAWRMPAVGSQLHLPREDFFGRPLFGDSLRVPVIALPSCQSCAMRRIDWGKLKKLDNSEVILVLDGPPDPNQKVFSDPKFRLLVESSKGLLPSELHAFAPNCLWVDRQGTILSTSRTLDLDADRNAGGSAG